MSERYLLDTCILSEYVRKNPNKKVIEWLDSQQETNLFLSVVAIGELRKGIVKIEYTAPEKHKKLDRWLEIVKQRFDNRILALDQEILIQWGNMCGQRERVGRKLPLMDSLIAATALTHKLIIVTRNESDFQALRMEINIYNPWD